MPAAIADHLRKIHDQKIGYQATLRVIPGVTDLLDPALLDDPVYAKVVPPRLLAWYRTEPAQWFKHQVFGPNMDAAAVVAGARAANAALGHFRTWHARAAYLYELGQPMLLGSDTPSAPTYGNQPGYDTYKEMHLMAQAGIPLSAIFAAGTINNARQLGLEKDYGTVEQGKIANLLLLEANPLASVEAWTRIDKVILRGEPIDGNTLAADAARARELRKTTLGYWALQLLGWGFYFYAQASGEVIFASAPWSKAATLWGGVCLAGLGLTHLLRWSSSVIGWLALPPAALLDPGDLRPRCSSRPFVSLTLGCSSQAVYGSAVAPITSLLREADCSRTAPQPVHHHAMVHGAWVASISPSRCNATGTRPSCARPSSAKHLRAPSCGCSSRSSIRTSFSMP